MGGGGDIAYTACLLLAVAYRSFCPDLLNTVFRRAERNREEKYVQNVALEVWIKDAI
jgi:hypothetical protein